MSIKTDRVISIGIVVACLLSSVALFAKKNTNLSSTSKKESNLSFDWKDSMNLASNADVAVLDLSGPIMYGSAGGFGGDSGIDANHVIHTLEKIEKDKVKAVFLRLNTPGGTAAASQAIYEKIQSIKSRSKIKFYSFMQDVAASGGYYIASSCDKIYANPSTLTGSIGVIMQVPNYTDLANKIGYQTNTIKSGKFKDLGNGARKMLPEERELLQNLINDTYGEFVKSVSKGRHLPEVRVRELADGRIYTGNQALKNGLVDKLGQESDAIDDLAKELKLNGKPKTKNYTKSPFEKIMGEIGVKAPNLSFESVLTSFETSSKFQRIPLMLYK